MSSTTNTNPGNFANRPTEEVKALASLGGKASHKTEHEPQSTTSDTASPGISHLPASATSARNDDGTFTKGSAAAKESGHLGGLHAAGKQDESEKENTATAGRNEDGTFQKGSEAAKEAGHKGGLVASGNRAEEKA